MRPQRLQPDASQSRLTESILGVHWQFVHCRLNRVVSTAIAGLLILAVGISVQRHAAIGIASHIASGLAVMLGAFAIWRAREAPGRSSTKIFIATALVLSACAVDRALPSQLPSQWLIYAALVVAALYRDARTLGWAMLVALIGAATTGWLSGWSIGFEQGMSVACIGGVLVFACRYERRALGHLASQWTSRMQSREESRAQAPDANAAISLKIEKAIPDAVAVVDVQGTITAWNGPAQTIFGWDEEEIVGRGITDVIVPLHFHIPFRQALAQSLEPMAANPSAMRRMEMSVIRRTGEELVIELCLAPLDATPKLVAAFMQDITARKLAEKAHGEQRHLANAVAAMDQFLGVLGHELRTPIAGLRAMVEILQDTSLHSPDEAPAYLESLHGEILRMADTLNNLLESAKTYDPARHWNWSHFGIAEVCNEALESIRSSTDAAGITLAYDSDDPSLRMHGDVDAIRRLLMNLLSNAQKHTTAGSILVRTRAIKMIGHDWVEIAVRDTGAGIAAEVALRLGQPFALNVGGIDSDAVGGSGLGLAICRSIVAAHQGNITFESTAGAGTTFTVRMRADLKSPSSAPALPITQELAA